MPIDVARVRRHLQNFNFKPLFIEELGWDHCAIKQRIIIRERNYTLFAVAEKHGLVVFLFNCNDNEDFPDNPSRRRIEKEIAKAVHEHLIIYTDAANTKQVWQWVKREPDMPVACREHLYYKGQSGEALLQKLAPLVISLEEEDRDNLTIAEITGRVRAGFDLDNVTKRFYDYFKKEHDTFRKFIKNISNITDLDWYTSITLNRLMFIYFIQKKGFLDQDRNYLRNHLELVRKKRGKVKNHTFYQYFLIRLFHEGLGQQEDKRDPGLENLLGRVPYLNGGLYDVHQLEKRYKNINIPDKAFEHLFDFFDSYQWHLDERPLRADNEINPDVLGYIFEKYINQKQMGAYYTKEDITEYISRNTIIPFLLDSTEKNCRIAFDGEHSIWKLLEEDPERYIFPVLGHGIVWDVQQIPPKRLEEPCDLPPQIEEGIDTNKPRLLERRKLWNEPAPMSHALPTETWREVIARRQRYEEVRGKLAAGEVTGVNELITLNLNIRQFTQDVIEESCMGPELLRSFWKALSTVTILDPTCGSGAFLFSALNILEPLYRAALDRMQYFIDELEQLDKNQSPKKYSDFLQILEELHEHPNERYYILKKIILNNLYGVDIMDEAVEICKLRLFLKLVAKIEPNYNNDNLGLEPLPDIDFNIRTGNTLVGFPTLDDAKIVIQRKFDFDNTLEIIKEKAELINILFSRFRLQQTESSVELIREDKETLIERLNELEDELNHYLAGEYGVDSNQLRKYSQWFETHKPFHWFVEFYGIMKDGGFDIIIGNPPYVEYTKVKNEYEVQQYKTEKCGNLYPFCVERSSQLLSSSGRFSFIVLMASIATPRMSPLRELLINNYKKNWFINLAGDWHPGKLFEGVRSQFTIITSSRTSANDLPEIYTTNYTRWFTKERNILLNKIEYTYNPTVNLKKGFPKFSKPLELQIWSKIQSKRNSIASYEVKYGKPLYYRNAGIAYYLIAINFKQNFSINGKRATSSTLFSLCCEDNSRDVLVALLNSNLFSWYYFCFTDCYHLTKLDLEGFRIDISNFDRNSSKAISPLVKKLMQSIDKNSSMKVTNYKTKGKIKYQEFYPRKSKSHIDKIDYVLANHYGLTEEELDLIINYDIKYRLGITDQ